MKKIFIGLLVICLLVPFIGTFESQEVQAQDLSSCGYEVAYINDDGSFSTVSCYSDYSSAKTKMKQLGGDHVVRHNSSLSPTKIIAMNSGIAYSYARNGATINIYQNVSNHSIYYKQTYVGRHYELNYVDTERYLGNGTGMIEVYVNGFHGFTDLEYTDLVPSKYLRNGISIQLGGNNPYTKEAAFYVICSQNYYEAKTTNGYKELIYHIYRGYSANNSYGESSSIVIGVAPSEMEEGRKYYSRDGVNFYSDDTFNNYAFTYYNYYQFLPLRSKTNISANTLNSYISNVSGSVMKNTGQNFIDAQNKYGINALLMFAMACHESANGTSAYATDRNNLFGWNAVDADPSKASYFNSVVDCINEQAGINLRGYVDITDGRFFSSSLGNKGSGLNVKYASDPYWGMEIASIAYAIDKLSTNRNGSLTDYNYYSLSLIKDFDVEVKASASDSAKTLYTTQYGPYYQEGFIVIDLGTSGSYTKIQSTNPIDSSGNIQTHRTPITTGKLNPISYGEYDYDRSVAYVKSEHLTVINKKNENKENVDSNLSLMYSIDKLAIENGNLIIDGCGFIKGIDATDASKISETIDIVNILDDSIVKSYSTSIKTYEGIKFNDNHTYTYVGFDVSIPLNELSAGDYYLTISINNSGHSLSKMIKTTNSSFANMLYVDDTYTYRTSINSLYSYRFEIGVDSIPSVIDYTSINKPDDSIRNSLFNFDTLTLDASLNFYMEGQAMIYYSNYNDLNSIKSTIYAIDNKDNYIEIACENYNSGFDYTKALNSSYNLDYICFKANASLANLSKGTYMLVMKLQNGEYVDYVELSNISGLNLPSVENDGTTYRFFTSGTRSRLMLEVK